VSDTVIPSQTNSVAYMGCWIHELVEISISDSMRLTNVGSGFWWTRSAGSRLGYR
jgi:hypothetical protein